jgi:hypothetical protein
MGHVVTSSLLNHRPQLTSELTSVVNVNSTTPGTAISALHNAHCQHFSSLCLYSAAIHHHASYMKLSNGSVQPEPASMCYVFLSRCQCFSGSGNKCSNNYNIIGLNTFVHVQSGSQGNNFMQQCDQPMTHSLQTTNTSPQCCGVDHIICLPKSTGCRALFTSWKANQRRHTITAVMLKASHDRFSIPVC